MAFSICFWVTFAVSFLSAAPMFAILNWYGVKKGYVTNGVIWRGRRMSVWWEETTLLIGDTVFLSLINACNVEAYREIGWPKDTAHWVWLFLAVQVGALGTVMWYRDAVKLYATSKFWGSHWCGPQPRDISPHGKYHTVYFLIEAISGSVGFFYVIWQPVSWNLRIGILAGHVGYIMTLVHFLAVQQRLEAMYNLTDEDLRAQLQRATEALAKIDSIVGRSS